MNKLHIFFLFIGQIVYSQNLTIDKNRFFSGDGYVLWYITIDSTFKDPDSTLLYANYGKVFIAGESVFLDSLCSLFTQWNDQGYMKNNSVLKKEIFKLQYYPYPQRTLNFDIFIYPDKDKIERISTHFAFSSIRNNMPSVKNMEAGTYYRIIKVKMEGWLIDFHDFRQLKNCFVYTSHDKNGKRKIGLTISKDFEPAFRIYKKPYTIIFPKKVLFYSDWILSPIDAEVIKLFYKYLYIGPKKKHIAYPKALRYLKKLDDDTYW